MPRSDARARNRAGEQSGECFPPASGARCRGSVRGHRFGDAKPAKSLRARVRSWPASSSRPEPDGRGTRLQPGGTAFNSPGTLQHGGGRVFEPLAGGAARVNPLAPSADFYGGHRLAAWTRLCESRGGGSTPPGHPIAPVAQRQSTRLVSERSGVQVRPRSTSYGGSPRVGARGSEPWRAEFESQVRCQMAGAPARRWAFEARRALIDTGARCHTTAP